MILYPSWILSQFRFVYMYIMKLPKGKIQFSLIFPLKNILIITISSYWKYLIFKNLENARYFILGFMGVIKEQANVCYGECNKSSSSIHSLCHKHIYPPIKYQLKHFNKVNAFTLIFGYNIKTAKVQISIKQSNNHALLKTKP